MLEQADRSGAARFAALLGVKNEASLIEWCVTHLESIGVEFILACDAGSTDGTLEILQDLTRNHNLRIVEVDAEHPNPATPENIALAQAAGATWVLFLDADEFWVPRTGHLADCAGFTEADMIRVRRLNVPLARSGPQIPRDLSPMHQAELLLCARPIPDYAHSPEQLAETPWILGAPILPKVMARGSRIRAVNPGGHDVVPDTDEDYRRIDATDILIAHVPFTTYERFELKAIGIVEHMRRHPSFYEGRRAWHWARWADQWHRGLLREEFERQVLDPAAMATLTANGTIRSATSLFEDLG